MSESLGPVMLDIAGLEVSAAEGELLRHPLVGGVILFARNYRSPQQLGGLTAAIRALRKPELLIAVDHEGGRVQRFHEGFSRIPAMRRLGEAWDRDHAGACAAARDIGYVLAGELLACGVDFSFTPVLDVDFGASGVIGDRAFHSDPAAIAQLAGSLIAGLREAGMASVGKHFPGHGHVRADSHLAVPVDARSYGEIEAADLLPYKELIKHGLAAVMPAHVIYPSVDAHPAGFSSTWLRQILRGQLDFDGMIFSDDLSMEGASVAGGVVERGVAALAAGCDMVLLCNAPEAAPGLLDGLAGALDRRRAEAMRGARLAPDLEALQRNGTFALAKAGFDRFAATLA
jgi:beta-N-acetylhexosaminidase